MAKKKYSASVFVNIQNDIYSHIYSLKCENAALKIEIALRKQAKRIEDTYSKLAAELSLNLKIRLAKIMLFHADIAIDVVEKIFQKLTGAVTTYTVRDDHAICVDNEIYIAILRDQIGLLKTEVTEIERRNAVLKRNKAMLVLELALRKQTAPDQDLSPAEADHLLQTKLEIAHKLLAERMPLKTIKKILNISHNEANNSADLNSAVTAILRTQIAVLTSEIVELGRRGARLKRNKDLLELELAIRIHDKPDDDKDLWPGKSAISIWTKLDIINLMLAEKVPFSIIRKVFEILHK